MALNRTHTRGRCPSLLPPITARCPSLLPFMTARPPSLLLSGRIRVNPQEKHHSVAVERALAPLGFIFIVGLGSIPVGLINLIGAILGVAAMNQVRTPEEGKYVSRALRLNAIPVVVVIAAVLLFFLLSVLLSSAYGF